MIADFDAIEVKSEPEALLLEGKLIKQWKPRYNTDFTDDKRFLLVRVDPREELPRFRLVRLRKDDRSRYFRAVCPQRPLRKTLAQMRRQFGILLGDATPEALPDGSWQLYDDVRAEIYGFPNSVSRRSTGSAWSKACAFLEGKSREWLEGLRAEMAPPRRAGSLKRRPRCATSSTPWRRPSKSPALRADRSDGASVRAVRRSNRFGRPWGCLWPRRSIECFDISHISGTFVVASMVRFADGRPDRDQLPAFQDQELRRQRRLQGDGGGGRAQVWQAPRRGQAFPDLVVIDGGAGQVGAALKAFVGLGMERPPVVGLAKKEETIVFPDGRPPLNIPLDHPGLRLLQRLRDEAHRFANTYNADLRSKKIRESLLDDFPGLGPSRRVALFEWFGGIDRLRAATADEIAEVPGFGPKLSSELHAFLGRMRTAPAKTP
jgi:excinuclease ABC subunit C